MEIGTLSVVLWVLFAAAFLLSTGIGVVLAYHWFKFSTNITTPLFATIVYAGVLFPLLVSLAALAFSL